MADIKAETFDLKAKARRKYWTMRKRDSFTMNRRI